MISSHDVFQLNVLYEISMSLVHAACPPVHNCNSSEIHLRSVLSSDVKKFRFPAKTAIIKVDELSGSHVSEYENVSVGMLRCVVW
jgi:hypothetical protein